MKTNILKALTLVSGIYFTITVEAVVNSQCMVLKPCDKRKNCVTTLNIFSKNEVTTVFKRSSLGITQNVACSKLFKRAVSEKLLHRDKPELASVFEERQTGIIFEPLPLLLAPEPKELVTIEVLGLMKTKKTNNDGRENIADRWHNKRLRLSNNVDLLGNVNIQNTFINTKPAAINYFSLINAVMRV